jgi:hypothetical protein
MNVNLKKNLALITTITTLLFGYSAQAGTGDTSIASIGLSGSVPEVFSVTARGLPGDLDLTPNVVVNNRLIGILRFKFNENAASITIGSSTASGAPQNGASTYAFSTPFTVSVNGACASLDVATLASPGVSLAVATDYKSVLAGALVANGIEEDCQLQASWGGTVASLPLAGVFSMNVTVTMVAL